MCLPHVKRHGNDRFHVFSTWNTRGVFVENTHEKNKIVKNDVQGIIENF